MRFIQDFIKAVVLVVRVVIVLVVLIVLVPRRVRKAVQRLVADEVITPEKADEFLIEQIKDGGRFGSSGLMELTQLSMLAGYGTSIADLAKFSDDYMN